MVFKCICPFVSTGYERANYTIYICTFVVARVEGDGFVWGGGKGGVERSFEKEQVSERLYRIRE